MIARHLDIVSESEFSSSIDFLSNDSNPMNCEDIKITTIDSTLNTHLYNHTILLQQL